MTLTKFSKYCTHQRDTWMNWSSWSQPLESYYRNSCIIRIQDGCRPPVNFPREFRYSGETNGLIWNLINLLGQESNVLSLNGYKLETPSENVLFPIHHKSGLFLPIHLHRPHIKLKRITMKAFVQENLEFLFRTFQRCNCWFETGWEDFKWVYELQRNPWLQHCRPRSELKNLNLFVLDIGQTVQNLIANEKLFVRRHILKGYSENFEIKASKRSIKWHPIIIKFKNILQNW